MILVHRKVASSSMSRLVAHFQIFRRLMKGKFDTVESRFKKARFKKESRFKKDCWYNRFFST